MELNLLTNKNKIFNLALILLLTLIIAYNIIYKKQVREEQLLKQKINEETKRNEVLKSIGKTEKTIDAYKRLLPKKEGNIIINTITDIAKQTGIKIMSIRPVPEQKTRDYIRTPFSLTLTARNYHAIGAFISKIENSQEVYIVEVINIRSNEQTKELSVDLTVSSIAFTQLEKQ